MSSDIRSTSMSGRLELVNIGKRHGNGTEALRGITLSLEPGITGLVGANGAGKTTLLKILATTMRPSGGEMFYDGIDVRKHPDQLRMSLGYVPQYFGVYQKLTAREFVSYLAMLKGLPSRIASSKAKEFLAGVGLSEVADRRLESFSRGMLQRVAIAQALINDPAVLLLDEPSAGLDPQQRLNLRELLNELARERTIVISTHILSDLDGLATSFVILRAGSLVLHGDASDVLNRVRGRIWEWRSPSMPRSMKGRLLASYQDNEYVRLRVLSDEPPSPVAVCVEPTLEEACTDALMTAR